jgi:site-specific DNA recombinase
VNDSPFPPASRLVAYCRDSGGRDQDLSIPQQVEKIGQWCQSHGYALVRLFKDAARSGTTTAGRDQFLEMFAYLSNTGSERRVAGVVIWEYARLSRQWDDSMFYLADLRRNGYGIYSMSDPVPEGIEGRLMESIIAWKNARFSSDLSRNIKRGKAYAITVLKSWCHSALPPGYQRVYYDAGTRRDGSPHLVARLEPDPAFAPAIQEAFRLRAAGYSYTEIRQRVPLYNRNSSLLRLLKNPIYIGVYDHNGLYVENYCPPLVDQDTYQRVQQVNEQSRQRAGTYHPRRITSPFLLSGLLRCALCGFPMNGAHTHHELPSGPYSYYTCSNRPSRLTNDSYCASPRIRKALVEERVVERLLGILDNRPLLLDLQDELQRRQNADDSPRTAQIQALESSLLETTRRIGRIVSAIQITGHSEALIDELKTLEDARDDIRLRLNALEVAAPRKVAPVDILTLASEMRQAIPAASGSDRQKLLRLVIQKVTVAYTPPAQLTGQLTFTLGPVTSSVAL